MSQELVVRDPRSLFASLVAFIAHPVVVGTLGLLTIVFQTIEPMQARLFYVVLLILLTFVPAAFYLFIYFKGNIFEMLELIQREARLVPYILMILGAIGAIIVLSMLQAPKPIFVMTLVLLANEVVLATINFWTKVSIHTATPTFTALTLGYLVSPYWYLLLLLVPLVAWARVYGKRHTLKQVIGGFLFATAVTMISLTTAHFFL